MLVSSQGCCSLDCTGLVMVKPRWAGKNFLDAFSLLRDRLELISIVKMSSV